MNEKNVVVEIAEELAERIDSLTEQVDSANRWLVDASHEIQRMKRLLFDLNLKLPLYLKRE